MIESTVPKVKRARRRGRGRPLVLPGTQVLERYVNGQPSLYQFRGEKLTRRQYHALVQSLQDAGELPPRKSRKPG